MTIMQTHSGALIDFRALVRGAPQPIRLHDVAHHLAYLNRYAGGTRRPYNVAEHSMLVHDLACELFPGDYVIQCAALLHDAHESVTGDPISPLKVAFPDLAEQYRRVQDAYDRQLESLLGWASGVFEDSRVKYCDTAVYAYESPRVRRIETPYVLADRIRLAETHCDHWPDDGVIKYLEPSVAKRLFFRRIVESVARARGRRALGAW